MAKSTVVNEAMTKTQLLAEIAENTEVAKKDVAAVLDELANQIDRHVKKGAVGHFTLPGLLKIKTVTERRAEPFPPGRNHGCRRQAGQRSGQGPRLEEAQGYGQVAIPQFRICNLPAEI